MPSEPSSSKHTLSRILASIRDTRSKLQKQYPRPTPDPVHPSPLSLPNNLPPPEDITSRLADDVGLEFALARKVSQAYVDKAVELQFLSKKRLSTHHKKALRAVRSSKAVSNLENFQSRLANSHRSFYKRDLRCLLTQAIDMAKTCRPTPVVPEAEDTDDEESTSPSAKAAGDSPDGSDDEDDGENDGGAANAEDERALQDMGARASVLLSRMYEQGFTFPKRHEKIKLAEATGLTYRQISIWYSNRRERNQPSRRNGASAASNRDTRSVTRESTVDFRETTEAMSPISTLREGGSSYPIAIEEDAPSPARTELEAPQDEDDELFGTEDEDESRYTPAGRDMNTDESRVPSLSASIATLDSTVCGPSSSIGDLASTDASMGWFSEANGSSFVNLDPSLPNDMMPTFDFNSAMNVSADVLPAVSASSIAFWDPSSFLPPPQAAQVPQASVPSAEFLAGFVAGSAYNNVPQYNPNSMMALDPSGWMMPAATNDPSGMFAAGMPGPSSYTHNTMPQMAETYESPPPSKRARVGGGDLVGVSNSSSATARSRTALNQTRSHRKIASVASSSRNASTSHVASTPLLHKTSQIPVASRRVPPTNPNGQRSIKPMPTTGRRPSTTNNPMSIANSKSQQQRMGLAPYPGLALPILQQ